MTRTIFCPPKLLALTALAAFCLQFGEGVVTPAATGAGAVPLPLKGNDFKQVAAQKAEALEVSDVTRENSNADDTVRAPKVLESRSLSDASDPTREEEAPAMQPVKKKNIWHQLSGIVTGGNKGEASPSPSRQEEEVTKDEAETKAAQSQEEPVKRKNIWHQLSGIVIGGKPASPSPARTNVDSGATLREKSLSRDVPSATVAATPTPTGKAPTVPSLREESAPTTTSEENEAKGDSTKFKVNVYPVEDPNMVRWAPMKLDDEVLVPVYFKPKPKHLKFDENTRDVTLVGSWSGWQDHFKLQPKGGTDCWDGVVNIPVGKHSFKFIVDDQWTIVGQWPVETDEHGVTNNVIEIPEPSSGMLMQERKSVFAKKKKFGLF